MGNKINKLEHTLKALANRRRLEIVGFLSVNNELSVGEIADKITLSFAATSRHLVMMERAGVLEKRQTSTTVLYRLANVIKPLLRVLHQ